MNENEAAQAMVLMFESPAAHAFYPSMSLKDEMPKLDLGSYGSEPTKSIQSLISALESGKPRKRSVNYIDDEAFQPVRSMNLRSSARKKRAQSMNFPENYEGNRTRNSSVDSDAAMSEPGGVSAMFKSRRMRRRTATRNVFARGSMNSPKVISWPISHRLLESDPNLKIGIYNQSERRELLTRFLEKRKAREWAKKIKYNVRKTFADSRLRVKGRFISKEHEGHLREMFMLMM